MHGTTVIIIIILLFLLLLLLLLLQVIHVCPSWLPFYVQRSGSIASQTLGWNAWHNSNNINNNIIIFVVVIIIGYTCMSFIAAVLCPEIWINSITNTRVECKAQVSSA